MEQLLKHVKQLDLFKWLLNLIGPFLPSISSL